MNPRTRRAIVWLSFGIFLGAFSSCKKQAPKEAAPIAPAGGLTPERRAELEVGRRQDEMDAARDHAELVRSAPPNFKPEPARSKLVMTLVLAKSRIRKGEPIKYRLEIQNVAREPYTFVESRHSFLKDGSLHDTFFKAYLTTPKGKKQQIESPLGGMAQVYEFKLPNERFMTDEQKHAAIEEMNRKAASERELIVTLQPGETLLTRADPPGSGFRPLDVDLSNLGSSNYRLQFVFQEPKIEGEEPMDPPEVEYFESRPVKFEVVP